MDGDRPVTDPSEWLARSGVGTYGPRSRASSDRRTRPIRREYFERTVAAGRCRTCGAGLAFRTRNGGCYYSCQSGGHRCYHIGFDTLTMRGYERIA